MPQHENEEEGLSLHPDQVPSFGEDLVEQDATSAPEPDGSVEHDASHEGVVSQGAASEGVGAQGPQASTDEPARDEQDGEVAEPAPRRDRRSKRFRGGDLVMRGLGLGSSTRNASEDTENTENVSVEDQDVSVEDAAESEATSDGRRGRRQRPKKPNEKLDSVLPESVPGPAISMIAQCAPFEYAPDKFATLMLDTDAIGGLSKKSANDADKGTIIQAMLNDRISIVTMGEMLKNDVLVIIPNTHTIQMMDEFNLLVKAPYTWCIVDTSSKSEFVADGVAPATFEECQEIALGTKNVTEVIDTAIARADREERESSRTGSHAASSVSQSAPENAVAALPPGSSSGSSSTPASGDVEPAPASTEAAAEFVEPNDEDEVEYDGPPEDAYGAPEADEFGDPDGEASSASGEVAPVVPAVTVGTPEASNEYGDDVHDGGDEGLDQSMDAYGDEEYGLDEQDDDPEGHLDDEVVTEEEMQDAVLRRFRDTRLDFDVTTEDFENAIQSFEDSTPYLPEETDARESFGGSWLADIIAAETDAANGEISARHAAHVDEARELYVSLMSQGIVKIAADTSIDDPNTPFGELKFKADVERDDRIGRSDLLIAEETERLDRDFAKGLETAASAAAEMAKVRYREENQGRLSREKEAVSSRMTSALEEMYEGRLANIVEDRRIVAKSLLDVLSTQSLASLAPMLKKHREDEVELAKQWSARITKVVDENLKADLARTATLQEDLDRSDRIQRLTQAHQEELDAKSSDYQRELVDLNTRLAETEARAQSSLDGLRASLQARIDEAESNARAGQERIQALEADRATIVERMDARRIEEVRAEKDSHAATILSFNQRWATGIMVRRMIYIVAFAVALLLSFIGYMIGLHVGDSGFIQIDRMAEALHVLL